MTKNIHGELELLGPRVRRIRQEHGFTQDELALRAKVDQSGLSKLERLNPRHIGPVPLTRVAEVLGLTFDELVEGTDYGNR